MPHKKPKGTQKSIRGIKERGGTLGEEYSHDLARPCDLTWEIYSFELGLENLIACSQEARMPQGIILHDRIVCETMEGFYWLYRIVTGDI